jgi:hypothetical protein
MAVVKKLGPLLHVSCTSLIDNTGLSASWLPILHLSSVPNSQWWGRKKAI